AAIAKCKIEMAGRSRPAIAKAFLSIAARGETAAAPFPLIGSEAVDQPATTGAAQVIEAATAVRPARGVRRIPRPRCRVIAQTLAVDVADHGGALGAAAPVAAGAILAGAERRAVHLRAGQDVVCVGGVADAGDHVAALRERSLHAELVAVAVQIVNVL